MVISMPKITFWGKL